MPSLHLNISPDNTKTEPEWKEDFIADDEDNIAVAVWCLRSV